MVFWESFCAAAFTAGSAVCILKLLYPQQQQPQALTSGSIPFVATMLLACLLSVFALLSVKGTHACWRPSSGAPWKRRCSSSSSSSSSSVTSTASTGDNASSASPTPEGTRILHAEKNDETGSSTPTPPSGHDESGDDDEGAGPEGFPLERRSSFVEVAMRIHG